MMSVMINFTLVLLTSLYSIKNDKDENFAFFFFVKLNEINSDYEEL